MVDPSSEDNTAVTSPISVVSKSTATPGPIPTGVACTVTPFGSASGDAPRYRRPLNCISPLHHNKSCVAITESSGGSSSPSADSSSYPSIEPGFSGSAAVSGGRCSHHSGEVRGSACCTPMSKRISKDLQEQQHQEQRHQEEQQQHHLRARSSTWSLKRAITGGRDAWGGQWLAYLRKRPRSSTLGSQSELPSGSSSSTSTARQKGTGDSVDIISSGSSSSSRNPFSPRLPAVDGQRDRYHHGGAKRNRVGTKAGRFMRGIAKLMGVLAVVWLTWLAMVETYVRTYCFQVRAMERAHPRGQCPIVKLTRESRDGWAFPASESGGDLNTGGALTASPGSGEKGGAWGRGENGFKRLRFAIVLMCDEGMWPDEYTKMAIDNKKDYAGLHGYDVIVASADEIDRSRPAAWSKLLILQKYLDGYDYLMFIDIDAFIMNPSFKLEWLLDVARRQQESGGLDGWGDPRRDADLIVTRDWNGPNSGVILIKNSDFSRWLLKEWWDQDRFVKGNWPYHYEQRGMHYLLQPDSWKDAELPYYPDYATIRAHVAVIDQCVMNSYLVHPWQGIRGRTKDLGRAASYVQGDFILHFAGKKGRVRLELVDHYYPKALKEFHDYAERLRQSDPEAVATSQLTRLGSPASPYRTGGLRGGQRPP